MANPERGTRSKAIREYLKSHPQAGPKEIVAALGAEGIQVTSGLVSNIKYGKLKTGGRGKQAAAAATAGTRPVVSGSQAIRGYLKTHRKAGPKEIQANLAKQGINVSLGLISFVKYHKPGRRSKAPTVRAAARRTRARAHGPSITIEQLLQVKGLVQSLGDIGKVRSALETLERLR